MLARFLSVRKLSHKPTQTHPTTLPKAGADSLRDRTGWRRQAPRIVTGRGNDTRELTPLTHTARDLIGAPHGDIGGLRSGQGEQGVAGGATAVPVVMLMCYLCMPGGMRGSVSYLAAREKRQHDDRVRQERWRASSPHLTLLDTLVWPRPSHSAMLTEAVADAKACTTLQNRP